MSALITIIASLIKPSCQRSNWNLAGVSSLAEAPRFSQPVLASRSFKVAEATVIPNIRECVSRHVTSNVIHSFIHSRASDSLFTLDRIARRVLANGGVAASRHRGIAAPRTRALRLVRVTVTVTLRGLNTRYTGCGAPSPSPSLLG